MDARRSRGSLTDGQEAVFQCCEVQLEQRSHRNPRLWCFLVCPVFLIILTQSISVNRIWRASLDRGLERQVRAHQDVLDGYNKTSYEILTTMVDYLQRTTSEATVKQVATYTHLPETVVNLNVEGFRSLPADQGQRVDIAMKMMWWQTTRLFPDVGCVFYADQSGLYVGYERLPKSFLRHRNVSGRYTFGAEFSPAEGVPLPVCSYCPPVSTLRYGMKTYYFVDDEGKFGEAYERHTYDPRERHWYKMAEAAKGAMTWASIYNHSSGNSMGTSAQRAIMQGSEVLAVVAGDFTVNLLSRFLSRITRRFDYEVAFIVNVDTGLMVASSLGRRYVARPVSPDDDKGLVRYHWNEISDPVVQSPLRALLKKYVTLRNASKQSGTMTSSDKRFLFTWTIGLDASFQAHHGWMVVVTCPVSAYMKESWRQQEAAANVSKSVQRELAEALKDHHLKTISICAAFALLAVLIMAAVGFAITQPLRRISTDMLSMAKLEFLSSRDSPDSDRELSQRRSRFLSFRSIRQVGHALSNLTRSATKTRTSSMFASTSRNSSTPDDPSSEEEHHDEESWSDREYERERLEEDIRPVNTCARLATPKEVVDMREAFAYMVAGLRSFARYLDPEIMRMLVQSRRQAQLGMGKAQVTVFFSDIANFTTIAESLEPEVFMSMLSEYLDEMSKIIMAKHGVVGEFIGDAIMAWWNVPIDLGPEHTSMALDAALTQQQRLEDLRHQWQQRHLPDVRVRMGLVRGDVLAGNIGSSQRMKYGLVGDSVNLASRLEGLCKYYGVSIIIEQDAAFAPGVRDRFRLRLLDWVIVKGRTQATELYELVCEGGHFPHHLDQDNVGPFIDGYGEIHQLYRSKNFNGCREALRKYCQNFPEDAPSKMLLRRVETLLLEGLPPDWTPVHVLVEK